MKLTNEIGETFHMTVVGYEFPQLEREPFDSDWLKVRIDVTHSRGDWSKEYPCLLTWELSGLAEWLEIIATTNPPSSDIRFMEPEIRFEWLGRSVNTLKVHLHYGLRPSWSPYHGPNKETDLYVEFPATADELREAAASLGCEIKQFPVRVIV